MLIEEVMKVVASQFNLTFGEDLFINHYPDTPDSIVSLIDNRAFPPQQYAPVREPIVEFKLRADTYEQGKELGNQILEYFHSKENYKLGKYQVLHSYALTDVSYLYRDKSNNSEFSFELAFLIQNNI